MRFLRCQQTYSPNFYYVLVEVVYMQMSCTYRSKLFKVTLDVLQRCGRRKPADKYFFRSRHHLCKMKQKGNKTVIINKKYFEKKCRFTGVRIKLRIRTKYLKFRVQNEHNAVVGLTLPSHNQLWTTRTINHITSAPENRKYHLFSTAASAAAI